MAVKTRGRTLQTVRYSTTCPECGQKLPEGYEQAWYVPARDSRTQKAQVFCHRGHCDAWYGEKAKPVAPPWPTKVEEPIAIVPEVEEIPEPVVELAPEPVDTVTINGVEISTVGKHKSFALALRVAAATGPDGQKCNLLLVGPAGTGKSTLAKQVHEALGLVFGQEARSWCSLSLASDTPSSKLFGYKDANGVFQRTPFHGTYTGSSGDEGGTSLIDELDNGSDTVVAGLNQGIANGEAAFAEGNEAEGKYHRLIATANTFGHGGDRIYVARKQLDGASLDRFVTLELDYDLELEERLAYRAGEGAPLAQIGDLISTVRHARRRAAEKKLPLIFSPRACIDGALLLAAGIDFDTVLDIRVFAGVSTDVRAGLQ